MLTVTRGASLPASQPACACQWVRYLHIPVARRGTAKGTTPRVVSDQMRLFSPSPNDPLFPYCSWKKHHLSPKRLMKASMRGRTGLLSLFFSFFHFDRDTQGLTSHITFCVCPPQHPPAPQPPPIPCNPSKSECTSSELQPAGEK